MKRPAILICCALAIAGCTTTCQTPAPVTVTKVTDTACDWVKPISASKADTDDTKRQILAHDIAYSKNCQKGKTQ